MESGHVHKQNEKNMLMCVRVDKTYPLYRIRFLMLRHMWKTLL